jgi:hypothetical protein
MAKGDAESINRIGPALSSSSMRHAAQKNSTAGAGSTAFIAIPGMTPGAVGLPGAPGPTWITLLPVAGDVHIAFGDAAMGAATTADVIHLIGQREDWVVPAGATGFRMIRDAAVDCTLYWHVSTF